MRMIVKTRAEGGKILESTAEKQLICCEIEVYTEGEDRRAHARAQLREIAPDVFEITPFYLREVSGADLRWSAPERGMPIITSNVVVSFDQATGILQRWASRVFTENATLYR